MIDDGHGDDPVREGVVRAPGLRVHEGHLDVGAELHLAHRHQLDVEIGAHGPVLGSTHDAAESDMGLLLAQPMRQVLERHGARHGVRIGVVVREDDERTGPLEHTEQVREQPARRSAGHGEG